MRSLTRPRASASFEETQGAPLDDRLPDPPSVPFSAEALAELTAILRRKCFAWLDEPLPLLGGRSPRVACETAAGRRQVAQLVRTMPSMQIPGGWIPVPREDMLRALGIKK